MLGFYCIAEDCRYVTKTLLSWSLPCALVLFFRSVAGKRKLPGGEEGGSMVARKKKKTCRDQVDVFDHLATLHRKQMEM